MVVVKIVACLLVLALAANAQWSGNNGYDRSASPYRYGGYYGGYYPYAGVRTVQPAGAPVATLRAAAPPVSLRAYGYPSYSASQFRSKDELGQTRFGYADPGQAATNYRDAFGNQIGSYAYFNPEGKKVRVSYTTDSSGFRVLSNDLRVAPAVQL